MFQSLLILLLVISVLCDSNSRTIDSEHVSVASLKHNKKTTGGVLWCETPAGFSKASSSNGIMCDSMALLSSGRETFSTFEKKLCDVMANRSASIDKYDVRDFYRAINWVPKYTQMTSYALLNWVLRHEQIYSQQQKGLWLEFGVFKGFSVNMTSIIKKDSNVSPVYGFDFFEGLPEVWGNANMVVGEFNQSGVLPPLRPNVQLVKGLFDITLPPFLVQHPEKVVYANIDNDLFNGSVFLLKQLLPRFEHRAVLHFHELFRFNLTHGYSGNDEMKALHHVMRQHRGFRLQLLPYYGPNREACVFLVLNNRRKQQQERSARIRSEG